jgi:hypothetical protein
VTLPSDITDIEVGDFNQDGRIDVAVLYGSSLQADFARWVYHDGAAFQQSADVSDPAHFNDLAVLDLDNDGEDDLALVSVGDFNLNLPPRVLLAYSQSQTPVIQQTFNLISASYISAGDVDGDLDPDLVVASGNVYFTVVENQAGSFSSHPRQFYDAGGLTSLDDPFNIEDFVIADWDGDGVAELLSQTDEFDEANPVMTVLEDTGNFVYDEALRTPGFGTSGIANVAADLDQDGFMDYCGENYIVFGDGTYTPQLPSTQFTTSSWDAADFEGDGDIDLLQGSRVARNDGSGTFVFENFSIPTIEPGPLGNPSLTFGSPLATGDFDGDGWDDQVRYLFDILPFPQGADFHRMWLVTGNGTTTFESGGPAAVQGVLMNRPSFAFRRNLVYATDLDDDQDLDVLADFYGFSANDGTGYFPNPEVNLFGSGVLEGLGDVDQDGRDDVLVQDGNDLIYYHNDGGLNFTTTVLVNDNNLGDGGALLDLDDDGDLDAIGARTGGLPNGKGYYLIENLGGGVFSGSPVFLTFNLPEALFGAKDVDLDGRSDLLAANDAQVFVFRRTSTGLTYADGVRFRNFDTFAMFDWDADGDVDLAGRTTLSNKLHDGAGAGLIRQYGLGIPGTGSVIPYLGATGPVRAGHLASVRITRAVGGGIGLLAVGAFETNIPDFPFPGVTAYVDPWLFFLLLPIGGTAGEPGVGFRDFPFLVEPDFAGVTVFHQMYIADSGGTNNLTATNGLEISYQP